MLDSIKRGFGYGIGYILGAAVVVSIQRRLMSKTIPKRNLMKSKTYFKLKKS